MTNEPEKWVNLEDIAEHLKVSKDTIRVYVKKKLSRFTESVSNTNSVFPI